MHVEPHRVELTDGEIDGIIPRGGEVPGDVEAAVVAQDEVVRVLGIDPHGMLVRVNHAGDDLEGAAAVHRALEPLAEMVDDVRILRIDPDLPKVPRYRAGGAHLPP